MVHVYTNEGMRLRIAVIRLLEHCHPHHCPGSIVLSRKRYGEGGATWRTEFAVYHPGSK